MLLLHQSQHFFTTFRCLFGPSQDFHCSSLKLPSRDTGSKVLQRFAKVFQRQSKVLQRFFQRFFKGFFSKVFQFELKVFQRVFIDFQRFSPAAQSFEAPLSATGSRLLKVQREARGVRALHNRMTLNMECNVQCAMCNMQYAMQCAMCNVQCIHSDGMQNEEL